jgi:hypothetical protein
MEKVQNLKSSNFFSSFSMLSYVVVLCCFDIKSQLREKRVSIDLDSVEIRFVLNCLFSAQLQHY